MDRADGVTPAWVCAAKCMLCGTYGYGGTSIARDFVLVAYLGQALQVAMSTFTPNHMLYNYEHWASTQLLRLPRHQKHQMTAGKATL